MMHGLAMHETKAGKKLTTQITKQPYPGTSYVAGSDRYKKFIYYILLSSSHKNYS